MKLELREAKIKASYFSSQLKVLYMIKEIVALH